jgi:hypothetical protein
MEERTQAEVIKYIEGQSKNECKVVSAKIERAFEDLGTKVNVWNVRTNIEDSWWVVEGIDFPMNLYPQDAYYFGTDEAYSFHIGIISRMKAEYKPEKYVDAMTVESGIEPTLYRKLSKVASLIDTAYEVEDFQTLGVQCREILIELGNGVYSEEMASGEEQPQASNFKKKAELFTCWVLKGAVNKDYRKYIKRITESTWDFCNKLTHSTNATFYEVSSCVSLCMTLVTMYENMRMKQFDPFCQHMCNNCKSRKLKIIEDVTDEEGIVKELFLQCEVCGEIKVCVYSEDESGHVVYRDKSEL